MLADRIKELMDGKGITNSQLADELSVDPSLITRWLTEKSNPTSSNLIKMCEFFDVSADYILERTDERRNNKKLCEQLFDKLKEDDKLFIIYEMGKRLEGYKHGEAKTV